MKLLALDTATEACTAALWLDGEVRDAVLQAAKHFEQRGAEIVEVMLPSLAASVEPSNHIALAEAAHYHRRMGWFPRNSMHWLLAAGRVRLPDYVSARVSCRDWHLVRDFR